MDIVRKDYEPPVTIHALMMVVAGASFGSQFIVKKSNGGTTP